MADTQSIRSAIIAEAERQGLTAYAIAIRAELAPNTVKRYFNGDRDLTTDLATKVCDVLGLSLKANARNRKQQRTNDAS